MVGIIAVLGWLAAGGINEMKTTTRPSPSCGRWATERTGNASASAVMFRWGPIQRLGREVHFTLTQDNTKLQVVYNGSNPLPEQDVPAWLPSAGGRPPHDGRRVHANKIQAKCASKYESKPGAKPGAAARSATAPGCSQSGSFRKGHAWRIRACSPFGFLLRRIRGDRPTGGRWKQKPFLTISAERAVYSVWALVAIASGILLYGLIVVMARTAEELAHTNKAMPAYDKFAAWWAARRARFSSGLSSSSTYSAVVVWTKPASGT